MSDISSWFLQEVSLLSGHGVVLAFITIITILTLFGIFGLRNLRRSYQQEQQQLDILKNMLLASKSIDEIANELDKSSLAYKQVQVYDVSIPTAAENIQTVSNITSPQQFIWQHGYKALVAQSVLLFIILSVPLIHQLSVGEWRVLLVASAFIVTIILYLWMSSIRSDLQNFFDQLGQLARTCLSKKPEQMLKPNDGDGVATEQQLSVILNKIENVISQHKEAVSRMESSCEKVAKQIEMLTNTLVKQHEETHTSYLIITESQQKLVNSIEQIPEKLTKFIDDHADISQGFHIIVTKIDNILSKVADHVGDITDKPNKKSGWWW